MRVLVTGGCGYVGGHVVRRLQQDGHEVVVLDDLSSGHAAAVRTAELIHGDVRDPSAADRSIRGSDAVVHLAALKDAARSLAEPGRTFSVNVEGSRVMLEAAAQSGIANFVFSSSCAVYGTPTRVPIPESAPLRPLNPYGESKAIVEGMLPWFERAGGPRWISLRYANAAGAHPDGDLGERSATPSNLIPRVMAALTGELDRIEINGTDYATRDGTAVRDYVHVVDLAEAHVRAIEHLATGGRSMACNLGTGRGSSVREVVELATRISGRTAPVIESGRRPGDPAEVVVDADLARRELGWEPASGLEQILASAWRWHSASPERYGTGSPITRP
jgi:UDP-glucose-4-epimerase GalE